MAEFSSTMTIARAARLFRTRKVTSQQLCQHAHHLALFGEESLRLNAFAKLLPWEDVLEQARRSDARLRRGAPRSALEGVPVTFKANLAVGRHWELPHACSALLAPGDGPRAGAERAADETAPVYQSDVSCCAAVSAPPAHF